MNYSSTVNDIEISKLNQPDRSTRLKFFSVATLKSRIKRKSTKSKLPRSIGNEENTNLTKAFTVINRATESSVPLPKSAIVFVRPEPQVQSRRWHYTTNQRSRKQKVQYLVQKMKSKLIATKTSMKKKLVIIYDQYLSYDSMAPDYATRSFSPYALTPIFNKQGDYRPIEPPIGSKHGYRTRRYPNLKGFPRRQLSDGSFYESLRSPNMRIGCSKDLEESRNPINLDYYIFNSSHSRFGVASPNRYSQQDRKTKKQLTIN